MPSLMESIVKLDVGAQEPWPNDVKLYQPYAMEQILLPDNANCLAVQAFLHMCGLPFQIEHRANAEFMSPSGKVPFIKCGAFVVSELEPIVQFVANKGITLTEELSADQKSDMRAYMSIIYTVLMNAELYICWCDKRTYNEVTKVRNGSVFPWPLNHIQTWSKRSAINRKLKVLGWYQKTLESVYQEVENCCQALSERLDGKEYFFGSKPTQVDAYLYGHIFAILSSPEYSSELISIIMKFPNIVSHCKRICTNYVCNTSLNFSELLEPVNFASNLIMANNSYSYELKATNQVTAITRYLQYLNSESDLSELTHTSASNNKNMQTSSLGTVFNTQQVAKENPKVITEKYQSLSKSDHDYLTNLFCPKKPKKTEVNFVKLKSKVFSDTSLTSEDSAKKVFKSQKGSLTSSNIANEDKIISDIFLSNNETKLQRENVSINSSNSLNEDLEYKVSKRHINLSENFSNMSFSTDDSDILEKKDSSNKKNNSDASMSLKKSGILKKVSRTSSTFPNEDRIKSNISLSNNETEIQEENVSINPLNILNKDLDSKVYKSHINVHKSVANTTFSSEDTDKLEKKVSINKKNISKNSLTDSHKDLHNNVSNKSLTFVNESKRVSSISFFGEDSDELGKKDSFSENMSKNSLTRANEDVESEVSIKSLNMGDENKRVSYTSFSSEVSDKLRKKHSLKPTLIVKEVKNNSGAFQSSTKLGKSGIKDSLMTAKEEEKCLEISVCGEGSKKKVSKKPLSILNKNKKSSNVLFRQDSGKQVIKDSKISIANVNKNTNYGDHISISSKESGKMVSKTSLSILNENLFIQESDTQVKKGSKMSVASVNKDKTCQDISISSNEPRKNVSKIFSFISNENTESSNSSFNNQESEKQVENNSKISLPSVNEDEKYQEISNSSEESGKTILKKILLISNEDKKSSNHSFYRQEAGNQGKINSKISLTAINEDEKYQDISISSEESGKTVSKKILPIANENKKHSSSSLFSQDISNSSEESRKTVSFKILPISDKNKRISNSSLVSRDITISSNESGKKIVYDGEKYRDICISSDVSGKMPENEYEKYRDISISSVESEKKIANESEKYRDISISSDVSENKVTYEGDKYWDISISSEESGKKVVYEGEKYQDISISSDVSGKIAENEYEKYRDISISSDVLGNKVVYEGEKYQDISISSDVSGKIADNEYEKYRDISISSEESGKKVVNEGEKYQDISISSDISENKVVYDGDKYRDISISSNESGRNVVYKGEKYRDISISSDLSGKITVNDYEKYRDISISSEESEKKVVNEDEKYGDISISSDVLGNKEGEKYQDISISSDISGKIAENEYEKYRDISISSNESGRNVVYEYEKYRNISISSDESGIKVPNEYEKYRDISISSDESGKKVANEYEKYRDISISSEESGKEVNESEKRVSQKILPISNEDRKKLNASIFSQKFGKQGNNVSRPSSSNTYRGEKYLDISTSREECERKGSRQSFQNKTKTTTSRTSQESATLGENVSKKSGTSEMTVIENKTKSKTSWSSQESATLAENISKKSGTSSGWVSVDDEYVDACTFSDLISQKSFYIANEEPHTSTTSLSSEESSSKQMKIISVASSAENDITIHDFHDLSDLSFD